ncbi:MAG: MarR family transcriptional regulator [Propionibacteriaceae bacterium]|jgi:DNA-binding MarR family transcriptional regulator|nr:MarR family transcriptional regulator [Propionibacteriaceae bacterium]
MSDERQDAVDELLAEWRTARPDLDTSPMGVIGRINRVSSKILARLGQGFSDSGLDFPSFDVLATLRRTEGHRACAGKLAETMMVSPGAVTQRMTNLEKRGLIQRTPCRKDRRRVWVSLTDAGMELIDSVLPAHVELEKQIVDALGPDEQEQLASLLRKLLLSLTEEIPDAECCKCS